VNSKIFGLSAAEISPTEVRIGESFVIPCLLKERDCSAPLSYRFVAVSSALLKLCSGYVQACARFELREGISVVLRSFVKPVSVPPYVAAAAVRLDKGELSQGSCSSRL
jgi:hypothetical protein